MDKPLRRRRDKNGGCCMDEKIQAKVRTLAIDQIERHILLCCNQTKPKCCDRDTGLASWSFLKQRLDELKPSGAGGIYHTKANCLRICTWGPVAVV